MGRTRVVVLTALVLAAAVGTGCSTTPVSIPDPLESNYNRPMYDINEGLSDLIGPVADAYADYVPKPVQNGVSNFFDNAAYPGTMINNYLQGKFAEGTSDLGRFLLNSTVGIGGIFDPATKVGLPRHNEDFGQTLAVWGLAQGDYLTLPLLGPSSYRAATGVPLDMVTSGLFYVGLYFGSAVTLPITALRLIDTRARLRSAIRLRDESALDPYAFTREAYQQRRINLIFDGDPPARYRDDFEDDFDEDELEDLEEIDMMEEDDAATQ